VTEPLLTARELADLLGFSAATVVDWAEQGKLPAFKVGGRLRFRLAEVEEWLEGRRVVRPDGGGETPVTPPRPANDVVSALPVTRRGEEHA
jgi:excisionase family DNA binding protein